MKPEIYPAWPAGWFKNDVVAKPAAKQHHGFTAPRSVARMLAPADIVSSRSIWNNPAGCKVVKRTFDCGLGRYSSQPPHATGNTVIATAQLSTHCNYPAGWWHVEHAACLYIAAAASKHVLRCPGEAGNARLHLRVVFKIPGSNLFSKLETKLVLHDCKLGMSVRNGMLHSSILSVHRATLHYIAEQILLIP